MSSRARVTLLVWLALSVVVTLALPVLAQEQGGGDGATTTTVSGSTTTTIQLVPAVPINPPDTPEAVPDWTYRYLVPTGLVLAALVILMTSIRYFTNVVRKRYRTVEE
jgi:hypothetical protein